MLGKNQKVFSSVLKSTGRCSNQHGGWPDKKVYLVSKVQVVFKPIDKFSSNVF